MQWGKGGLPYVCDKPRVVGFSNALGVPALAKLARFEVIRARELLVGGKVGRYIYVGLYALILPFFRFHTVAPGYEVVAILGLYLHLGTVGVVPHRLVAISALDFASRARSVLKGELQWSEARGNGLICREVLIGTRVGGRVVIPLVEGEARLRRCPNRLPLGVRC